MACDPGHELRVVAHSASHQAVPARGYEVPRSGWPVPTRPVTVPAPDAVGPPPAAAPAEVPASGPESTPAAAASHGGRRPPPEPVAADDIAADIAAILAAGKPDVTPPAAPDDLGPGVPRGRNRQDVFDQIAASMSRARSYDLGSIELERRFDDFDRLPEAAAPTAPPRTGAARSWSRSTEVLEDLDAIRSLARDEIPLDPGVGGRSVGVGALEPGDVILSTTSHPLSAQIRAVTDAEVSHAAVYVGEGRIVEAIDGGVVLRSLETALGDDSLAVAYRHRDMTPTAAAMMIPFLEEHARLRTPFDRWGLVQVAPGQLARAICNRLDGDARRQCLARAATLRVGTNDENAFFCSELVLEGFGKAGLSMSTLEPSWSSPGEIVELHHNGLLDYVGHLKG
jgi:hypothetical protein